MRSMQSALVARLLAEPAVAAIVGTKIKWGEVPQGTAKPYIRLQVVSDPRPQHLKGYNRARGTRVQADCYGSTYLEAQQLTEILVEALAAPATFGGIKFGHTKAEGPRDLGEDTTKGFVHRMSLDLLVWHRSA